MDDFMKTKTVFIITFLAALFAMYPIMEEYGDLGITLFELKVTIKTFYLINMGLLGLSVYIFSLDYISEKPYKVIRVIGNTLYSLAVLWPIVFVLFYLTTILISYIIEIISSQIISKIMSIFLGVLVSLIAQRIFGFIKKGINYKEKESIINKMLKSKSINPDMKTTLLEKANVAYESDIYDLVATYCFQAIINHLKNELINNKVSVNNIADTKIIELAFKTGVLPGKYANDLRDIRLLRNKSVHSIELEIDKKTATELLDKTKTILKEAS